jgi:hypothetical protein
MNLSDFNSPMGRRTNHAQLKRWTRELLHLDEDVTITINELRCPEPGCPDLETVIGISPAPGQWRRLRVAQAAAEVTEADLRLAVDNLVQRNS